MTTIPNDTLAWLLDGDPAVAWQVQRDLLDAPEADYESTRARVATEGWGARLLSLREPDGRWGGGLYGPKWTSTFYTMRLLYWFGLDGTWPVAVETCAGMLDFGLRPDGSVKMWRLDYTDVCVTAMTLALAVRFGHARDERVDAMAGWLLDAQLSDGGWNCNDERPGCRVSSFHTTLSALEALHDYALSDAARRGRVHAARDAGYEYFRRHRVFLSETRGEVVRESFTRFSFPPRWFFDVLRALDHFRAAALSWDERLRDALDVVNKRRRADGRWNNQNRHAGLEHFRLEDAGKPSRWNTLRALRVLAWFEAESGESL
jgi:hypothetical protein